MDDKMVVAYMESEMKRFKEQFFAAQSGIEKRREEMFKGFVKDRGPKIMYIHMPELTSDFEKEREIFKDYFKIGIGREEFAILEKQYKNKGLFIENTEYFDSETEEIPVFKYKRIFLPESRFCFETCVWKHNSPAIIKQYLLNKIKNQEHGEMS